MEILTIELSTYENVFYALATLLVAGFIVSKTLAYIKIPKLSSYVIAGMLVGPYGIQLLNVEIIDSLQYITHFGLGMIAFMIGMEFHRSSFFGIRKILFITIFQALLTALFIFSAIYYINNSNWQNALLLGVIGAATAPGPIILFIKNKGIKKCNLKNILLPVVALDDAITVILYAFAISIVSSAKNPDLINSGIEVFRHIAISIVLGVIIGAFLEMLKEVEESSEQYLTYSIVAIAAGIAFSIKFNGSYIITLIIAGMVFTNFLDKKSYHKQDKSLTRFSPPIFILFYTMAGALLPINEINKFWPIIFTYIFIRIVGKILGFYIPSKICHIDNKVAKYIGISALPQAGIAIGLATSLGEPYRSFVLPVIIGAVFFFQLIGPYLVELSFKKAGNYSNGVFIPDKNIQHKYDSAFGFSYSDDSSSNIFKNAIEKIKHKNKK